MRKQYILYIVVILLSIINAINFNNASALSYSSEVGVGFTFNPTLSVSLSSSDLTIQELPLGTTGTSNEVNVLVRSNAAYGYTLSATVGNNSTYNSDSLINNIDNNKVFSNIAVDADLSSLNDSTSTNIWGYSYKDNTVDNPTWSSYNGLSLYSSTSPTTLIDLNSNTSTGVSSLDFKIAAKASNTQPSGEYSNIINFVVVSKVGTVSLLDAFIASNATMQNGYYTMQGMTPAICNAATIGSSLQLLDVRDSKLYWVTKLADNNCWMTQNLELDLDSTATAGSANALTSENTNLKTYGNNGYDSNNGYSCSNAQTATNCTDTGDVITWVPARTTVTELTTGGNSNFPNTAAANSTSYSYNPGDVYYYTSSSTSDDIKYTSLSNCTAAGHTEGECKHYEAGNYYNWSASVASNNSSSYAGSNNEAGNSVCPKGWRLPKIATNEFRSLVDAYNISSTNALDLHKPPLYFVRSGYVGGGLLSGAASEGDYWSSTAYYNGGFAYRLSFSSGNLSPGFISSSFYGFSVRCIAE